ncbi:App1 family protein [Kribbia dieselivorans]|uniref:App1 family protein n=1 Tax=Kribbia dieselivorans TaxID=331526 RepID=UPI000838FEBC|nr:phosphatase domain-containing protein [Kribbia dieselivorans]
MSRPHAAAQLEDAWHNQLVGMLERRGWGTRVLAYTGYGTGEHVRILGRVLMTRRPYNPAAAHAGATWLELRNADRERRGWKSFFTAPAVGEPVEVTAGDRTVTAYTDRSGIIDVMITGHGLEAGWHTVTLRSPRAADATATVHIVGDEQTFGIVSDIDDTVITTMLPRPMIAAWNTFFKHESTRSAVPGMATFYRELLAVNPGAPIVYVSTGAWNTVPQLMRFFRRSGYPIGPLLMTDWGPTNTGWFRSGQDHKRACLHRLARELPQVQWLLVGDDGQHDPSLYGEFAEQRPERVRAIAIRELTLAQSALSHGVAPAESVHEARVGGAPVVSAETGYALLRKVRDVLGLPAPAEPVLRTEP